VGAGDNRLPWNDRGVPQPVARFPRGRRESRLNIETIRAGALKFALAATDESVNGAESPRKHPVSNEENMRIAITAAALLFALAACSTTENKVRPYQQPNSLMSTEIDQRIDQIQYQHREELLQNLLWLAQTGEQTIPSLLRGLANKSPKVRSSCCWVLGRIGDRRTVPNLQDLVHDKETRVRFEACRTLVLMGDLEQSPKLIEGLDSDRKEVRYMCHEALKAATGHDFGYDHLSLNQSELRHSVLRWRQWWGSYAGDTFFASRYEEEHGLNKLAAPSGETQTASEGAPAKSNAAINPEDKTTNTTGTPVIIEEVESAESVLEHTEIEVPPTVPPVQTETTEVSTEQSTTTTGSATGEQQTTTQSTKPLPVITEIPVSGSTETGGGNESGGK